MVLSKMIIFDNFISIKRYFTRKKILDDQKRVKMLISNNLLLDFISLLDWNKRR